jgi:hypothetical protein
MTTEKKGSAAKPAAKTARKPASPSRKKPGSQGKGDYYHVGVQATAGFEIFRTQDVGDPGHIQRVAGQRSDGSWETVKWLIGKEDAHIEAGKLIPDSRDAEKLLDELGAVPTHIKGDIFEAKPGGAGKTQSRADKTSHSKGQASQR